MVFGGVPNPELTALDEPLELCCALTSVPSLAAATLLDGTADDLVGRGWA